MTANIKTNSQTDSGKNQTACLRCGTCCRKGGPSLHTEDRGLIEKGNIPLKYLFTIRKGEPSFDNIKDVIQPARTDIIKIKSKPNTHECIFFDPNQSGCRIYMERPIECRKLKCWNTKEIISLYDQSRIGREELLSGIDELWNLVQDHQSRCSYHAIAVLAEQIKKRQNHHEAFQKLNNMIQYDSSLRVLLIEKKGTMAEMIEFLLGRPLTKTIAMFGLTLKA